MYMNGNELSVDVPEIITSHSRIALNLTPRVPMPPKFSARVLQEFPRATYIAQDQADLEMMLGGAPVNGESDYPGSLSSIYFRKNKGLMYLNAQHWIEEMKCYDFAFGSRIHGNVASILAGTPGHVIAHDSRTRELAEFFEIPWTRSDEITADTSVSSLFEHSDWSRMVSGHNKRFNGFLSFLESHGIKHIYSDGSLRCGEAEFDRRTRQADIGSLVKVGAHTNHPSHIAARHYITGQFAQKSHLDLNKRVSKVAARVKSESNKREARIVELKSEVSALKNEVRELRLINKRRLSLSRLKKLFKFTGRKSGGKV